MNKIITMSRRKLIILIGLFSLLLVFSATPSFALSLTGITSNGQLISIDSNTGVGTLIGNTGLSNVEALEHNANGDLVAIANNSSLYEIDPVTLNTQFIGGTGFQYVEALAFNVTETILYGAASLDADVAAERLITIDQNTGAGTDVGIFGGTATDMDGLAMSTTGTLYGTDIDGFTGNPGFYRSILQLGHQI